MKITVDMEPEDFDCLVEQSMQWGPSLSEQCDNGRFETVGGERDISKTWKMAYWMGDSYANVLLAKSYLKSIGHTYDVVWDMAVDQGGQCLGYILLTNYYSEVWKFSDHV